ncbi:hypothetical protein [Terrisporobacter mayombei]|uniref:Two-component sensor histidine kinase n=1 Tax=Terrisporobacter mayombei TaxID=1541 RepID=A0ABY9Q1K9_9FIRM|nr:hypothetical protein [Terrisporobacter mayombei]MCC3867584.1 hypothetical protein [Terrisporobacter mayombei]WMT81846.1 hypothetical protein TEMA_21940 [Terrisporobacter mayombei]
MSRLEKSKKEKYSKKKYKTICRMIFMFMMLVITTSSILIIDYRINEVLDNDSKNDIIKYIMDIF